MSDKLLIPVDNLNSYVNHHQYRVSLFKVGVTSRARWWEEVVGSAVQFERTWVG